MKKQILVSLILLSLFLTLNAQIYTPSGVIQGSSGNNNVGIGTTTPQSKLHIQTNNSERAVGFFGATGSGEAGIYFDASNGDISGSDYGWLLQNNDLSVELVNASANPINFKTTELTRMTISGNGNVGIGTTSPNGPLDVWRAASNGIITRFGTLFDNGQAFDLKATQTSSGHGYYSLDNSASDPGWQNIVIPTGSVCIGTTTPGVYMLNVDGKIRADEIVINTSGADFVFAPDYNLTSLLEVEKYITENKHLPDLSPASEMQENGMNVSEMQTKLLQKIEELTLYAIEQNKKIEQQNEKITTLEEKIERIESASK